jgi:hypothetical protein
MCTHAVISSCRNVWGPEELSGCLRNVFEPRLGLNRRHLGVMGQLIVYLTLSGTATSN